MLLDRQDLPNRENGLLLHSHPGVGGLATTRLGASHAGWYYPLPLLLLLRREEGALDRARQGRVLMGAYLNARRKAVAPAWRSSPPPTVLWVFTEEIDAPEVGPLGVTALVTALIVERTPNAPVREG